MFSIVYCRTGNFLQQSGYNPAVRIAFIILVFCSSVLAQRWLVQTSGLDTNLRGISVKYVSTKGKRDFIVWASGSNGVILRSTNGGRSWKQLNVPDASDFDFRDIEGFDANTAYVMSSGDGGKSRIYKTIDGGNTWTLQYSDKRPGFFSIHWHVIQRFTALRSAIPLRASLWC